MRTRSTCPYHPRIAQAEQLCLEWNSSVRDVWHDVAGLESTNVQVDVRVVLRRDTWNLIHSFGIGRCRLQRKANRLRPAKSSARPFAHYSHHCTGNGRPCRFIDHDTLDRSCALRFSARGKRGSNEKHGRKRAVGGHHWTFLLLLLRRRAAPPIHFGVTNLPELRISSNFREISASSSTAWNRSRKVKLSACRSWARWLPSQVVAFRSFSVSSFTCRPCRPGWPSAARYPRDPAGDWQPASSRSASGSKRSARSCPVETPPSSPPRTRARSRMAR